MSTPQNETLKRTLGMREAVTITVGTVVGVGLFTTGAQIVGSMGSAVILATFMAMVISVYPSHLYAEMSAALPFAGGTYKYAQLGLGKAAGMLAGWNFIASLVAVTSGEALAFSFYFKTLFRAFGVELPISDVLLAAIPIVLFIVTNIHGTEMTGRLQNGFMFFFWGVAIIWALMMIPNIHLPSYMVLPESMNGLSGWSFIGMVAMIWWCFAGFETCCALGEEIKHPRINLPRALKLAAALGLRKRHPELGRPYKAPLIEVGVPVSILIYAIMLFQLDRYAIVSGIIWCVVGLVVYYICHAKYGDSNILNINDSITDEAPPSPEERAKMDKEYLLWKSIVAAFCIIAVLLYVIPLIF